MEKHWFVITIVVIITALFIVLYLIKNRKDKKDFLNKLNADDDKPELHDNKEGLS